MINVDVSIPCVHVPALTTALSLALPGKVSGVSHHDGDGHALTGPATLNLYDTATQQDQTLAQTVAAAHDPVFLSVDKTTISANGTDAATITVQAPKPGAAAVTLSVSVNGAAGADFPITLTNGIGSDTITSLDPAVITVTVKSPTNRSTDTISIKAI